MARNRNAMIAALDSIADEAGAKRATERGKTRPTTRYSYTTSGPAGSVTVEHMPIEEFEAEEAARAAEDPNAEVYGTATDDDPTFPGRVNKRKPREGGR